MRRFITIKGVSDIMSSEYRGVNSVQELQGGDWKFQRHVWIFAFPKTRN